MDNQKTYCGFVGLIGRPNVGKSTLLNQLLDKKLSIVSRKPQTTRHRIVGIKIVDSTQILYVDTPGIQHQFHTALNDYMNQMAETVMEEGEILVFVSVAGRWTKEDDVLLKRLSNCKNPVILVLNKIDRLANKKELLAHLTALKERYPWTAMIPLSALSGEGVDGLEQTVKGLLPASPWLYPEDQVTDRNERFIAAEFLREQAFAILHDELPYAVTVVIEKFKQEKALLRVDALIYVARETQKKILIGKQGETLKRIATRARKSMETFWNMKVYLQVWVKVKESWLDDAKKLSQLGYD